jgi:hypothetical protein
MRGPRLWALLLAAALALVLVAGWVERDRALDDYSECLRRVVDPANCEAPGG